MVYLGLAFFLRPLPFITFVLFFGGTPPGAASSPPFLPTWGCLSPPLDSESFFSAVVERPAKLLLGGASVGWD